MIRNDTLMNLRRGHRSVRLMLLLSLVFFLTGLFALVSRWPLAVPIIVFACVFRLAAGFLVRKKYNDSFMEAAAVSAAETALKGVTYTAKEPLSPTLLSDLGLTPPIPLAPGTQGYHVLRGQDRTAALTVCETSLIRVSGTGRTVKSAPVTGILITASDALPGEEEWVLLWHKPLDVLAPLTEYRENGWQDAPPPGPFPQGQTACFIRGASACMKACAGVLHPYCQEAGVALAACGGRLSLLLPGAYYAVKPDITKAPSEEMFKGGAIPGVEVIQKMLRALPG